MAESSEKRLSALLAESKKLARFRRRRLSPTARAEIAAIMVGAEEALASGDPARIDVALHSLEEAFARHLSRFRKSALRGYAEAAAIAVALAFAFRALVGAPVHLDTGAMAPSLLPGDTVWVSRFPYLVGALPERGEVVLLEAPEGGRVVKRIIGLPGETVELVDREIVIDGEALPRRLLHERFEYWSHRRQLDIWHPRSGSVWLEGEEGRAHATLVSRGPMAIVDSQEPLLVPDGHVFVMGDNREAGEGLGGEEGALLPIAAIRGRVGRIIFSRGPGGGSEWGEKGVRWERLFATPDGKRLVKGAADEGALGAE